MKQMKPKVAATTLDTLLPGRSVNYWTTWLQNNRNQARPVSYRIPYEHIRGNVVYDEAELRRFASWEVDRRAGAVTFTGRAGELVRAFESAPGKVSGRTGRRFDLTSVLPQHDAETGEVFVQVITGNPFAVYRLGLDEAASLAGMLKEAADSASRANRPPERRTLPPIPGNRLLILNLPETAEYLQSATVLRSIAAGHAEINTGQTASGVAFVMLNDRHGKTVVSESL